MPESLVQRQPKASIYIIVRKMEIPLHHTSLNFLWAGLTVLLPSLLIGILAIKSAKFLSQQWTRVKAPRVGKTPWIFGTWLARADFTRNAKALTEEAYHKHKHSMYWIQTSDLDRLVLPSRYIDALRKLPESYLDSKMAVVERNLGWYSRVDIILKSTAHVEVCRRQLVQNLQAVTAAQIRDIRDVFRHELAVCFKDVNGKIERSPTDSRQHGALVG